jgi:hypothetical protein
MNLDRFSGAGSTPSRRRFWDKVQEAVMASRKVEGRHVTIDEHPGAGSVINVDDTSTRRPTDGSVGACCYDDGTCDDLIESECTDAGGNWQGPGTTCDDDPPPCVGVCCEESGCVDDSTPDSCAADGGTWIDFGTTCADDPPPCSTPPMPPCCGSTFDALDGSCRKFLTKTYTVSYHSEYSVSTTGETCSITVDYVRVSSVDPDTCESSVECSGFYTADYHPPSGPDVHHEGDPCSGVSGDCGSCPGGCPTDFPSEAEPTCGSTGCSCSATEMTCSISHTQDPDCGPNLTGSCSTEVSLVLSDECTQGTGACCNFDSSTCDIQTECDCDNSGGSYQGDDTVCDPDPCGFGAGFSPPP